MPRAPAPSSTQEYVRERDGATFTIWADRHGSWQVQQGDKVLITRMMPNDYFGRSRWGSKKLEAEAIEQAKAAIEKQEG